MLMQLMWWCTAVGVAQQGWCNAVGDAQQGWCTAVGDVPQLMHWFCWCNATDDTLMLIGVEPDRQWIGIWPALGRHQIGHGLTRIGKIVSHWEFGSFWNCITLKPCMKFSQKRREQNHQLLILLLGSPCSFVTENVMYVYMYMYDMNIIAKVWCGHDDNCHHLCVEWF